MSLILDLIFPKTCLVCGKNGQYFCSKCLSLQKTNSIKFINTFPKEGSLSIFRYETIIKKAILELKYKFVTDLVDELVTLATYQINLNFPHLLKYWQENNFVLVPIPLFYSRQNWRGFNQSILLGQKLATKLNIQFSDQIIFRNRYTHTQAKIKNHLLRQSNLNNAFTTNSKTPKNIILFDDVTSSFSTLNSAFQSINHADLSHCWYLTLAG
jgi:competence protein ComFC